MVAARDSLPYTYVNGNPVNAWDPSGHRIEGMTVKQYHQHVQGKKIDWSETGGHEEAKWQQIRLKKERQQMVAAVVDDHNRGGELIRARIRLDQAALAACGDDVECVRGLHSSLENIANGMDKAGRLTSALLGVQDFLNCNGGKGGCGSMAMGFVPLGRVAALARMGRALQDGKQVDRAADAARDACRRPGNSFTGDTPVLMADGTKKPIEDVERGDEVMAKDPETGKSGPRKVVELIRHRGAHKMVAVRTSDGLAIDATDRHPFWVASRGEWVDAVDLEPGDLLVNAQGDRLPLTTVVLSDEYLTAYNLTVADLHTYFAGTQSVLVHNDGGSDFTIAGDYQGRVDRFTYGGQAHFEVHVYRNGAEVGIYGSNGWIGKHGHPSDMNLPNTVENRLKGVAIDEMRRAGRLGPNDSIKGNAWKRPHVGDVC